MKMCFGTGVTSFGNHKLPGNSLDEGKWGWGCGKVGRRRWEGAEAGKDSGKEGRKEEEGGRISYYVICLYIIPWHIIVYWIKAIICIYIYIWDIHVCAYIYIYIYIYIYSPHVSPLPTEIGGGDGSVESPIPDAHRGSGMTDVVYFETKSWQAMSIQNNNNYYNYNYYVICIYIYICIYTHKYKYVYYIYIYIERERDRWQQ